MPPPAGGSRGIAAGVALAPRRDDQHCRHRDHEAPSPMRRLSRTEETGVMHPSHGRRRLRLSAALSLAAPPSLALPALALLLLSAPLPAVSGPIKCPRGNTWDLRLESCRACSVCSDPRAPVVVVPCEPHRDTQCGTLSALGIDWSFAAPRAHNHHHQHQKGARRPVDGATTRARSPGGGAAPSQKPLLPPRHVTRGPTTPPPPRLMEPASRRVPRPRAREEEEARDALGSGLHAVAARPLYLETLPSGFRREGMFLLPEGSGGSAPGVEVTSSAGDSGSSSEGEEGASIAEWGWRHWLAAGVSMAVVCVLVLVLAPSALKGLRKRCSYPGSTGRHRDKEKGQHGKIVKSDQAVTKSSKRNGGLSLHSSSHRVLHLEELLASGRGSQRQESKNVYVENTAGGVENLLLPPANSSVLVASISPGLVQTVRVEIQEDGKNRRLSTNCLGLDCASRTMFIGRSSAV
ncbi:uncharacterized protein LOC124162356 [Ischnura elegans]|uniref:uncharacterized protein LOC124162356 n=1 Tax=Ischnura elegans TaxID=197161 RepID=UPI001ED88233|nr:uncharacterized protein LOC124162356 [Ischnura elegans]